MLTIQWCLLLINDICCLAPIFPSLSNITSISSGGPASAPPSVCRIVGWVCDLGLAKENSACPATLISRGTYDKAEPVDCTLGFLLEVIVSPGGLAKLVRCKPSKPGGLPLLLSINSLLYCKLHRAGDFVLFTVSPGFRTGPLFTASSGPKNEANSEKNKLRETGV